MHGLNSSLYREYLRQFDQGCKNDTKYSLALVNLRRIRRLKYLHPHHLKMAEKNLELRPRLTK